MTKTYAQLKKQIEALSQQADALRRKEKAGVVARIKEAIAAYELTAADLGLDASGASRARRAGGAVRPAGAPVRRRRAPGEVQARYRDESGNVWGGRGPRPRWLREAIAAGRKLEEFAV